MEDVRTPTGTDIIMNYMLPLKGKLDKETGFVINLKTLSQLIRKQIIDKVDHKNLNLDVPFMKGVLPSAENVAKVFWRIMEKPLSDMGCRLHSIKLIETENNYVEYFGE